MRRIRVRAARQLLRGVAAVALALAMTLAGTPTPAKASDSNGSYWVFVDILISAYEKGSDGRYTPAEINELIQEVIGAVNGAKADVLARLDSETTNELRGKAEAALTKAELLRVPWLAGPAINSMHDAAYSAKAHLGTVKDSDAALNDVGKAMIVLFTELNAAYLMVDADEGTNLAQAQRPYFRQGLEYLIREMTPNCSYGGVPNAGMISYGCSYDGRSVRAVYWAGTNEYSIDGGPPIPGMIREAVVQDFLMANTARVLAQQALDVLLRNGVPLP
ncbi:hypothetical protein ABNF97_21665 [Plantactinospora sp. B6F1]|uniref:hypothetical protein n=1 Tax=Plantactinospora sp. B6F1 TaxID=3158971 RepID=UPI0032D9081F